MLLYTPHPHLISGAIFGACSLLYNYKLYVYVYCTCTDEKNRKLLHAPKLAVAANLKYLKYACAYVCVEFTCFELHSVNFAHILNFLISNPALPTYIYSKVNMHA